MVVGVGDVAHVGLVLEAELQLLNALLVLFVRVVREAVTIQELRVRRVDSQALVEIFDGLFVHLLVIVALSTVRQEVDIILLVLLLMVLDGRLIVLQCLIVVLESVVRTAEAILNAPILLEGRRMLVLLFAFESLGLLEVLDCLFMVLLRMLTQALPVVGL